MRTLRRVHNRLPKRVAVALAVTGALILVGGVALANGKLPGLIPSDDGTIHACYETHKDDKDKKGRVRLVSDPENCKKKETAIAWNQVGPEGPPGAAGPQGIQGPQGPDGPAGPDGADGLPGADGADGLPGADGADGLPGADGADGADGATGPQGPAGNPGIRTIARSHGFAGPGIDGNYSDLTNSLPTALSARSLTFTKESADTGIRVTYTDNLRCYGNFVACQWEIRFDGNKCAGPVELIYTYYNSGGPLNIHRSETVVGTCFDLPAGENTIQIYIAPVPGHAIGDFHTGWRSYWAIEAEEVN